MDIEDALEMSKNIRKVSDIMGTSSGANFGSVATNAVVEDCGSTACVGGLSCAHCDEESYCLMIAKGMLRWQTRSTSISKVVCRLLRVEKRARTIEGRLFKLFVG